MTSKDETPIFPRAPLGSSIACDAVRVVPAHQRPGETQSVTAHPTALCRHHTHTVEVNACERTPQWHGGDVWPHMAESEHCAIKMESPSQMASLQGVAGTRRLSGHSMSKP